MTHRLEAHADISNVEIIDFFESDKLRDNSTFLGNNYTKIEQNIGKMESGAKKKISYNISLNGDALLGANKFNYNGEIHRLSPETVSVTKEPTETNELLAMSLVGLVIGAYMFFS